MSSIQRCYEQYSTIKRAFRRIVSVLSDHVITIFNPLAKIRKLVERCKKKWGNVRKHYEKRRKMRQICNEKAISLQRTSVIIGRLAFTWAKNNTLCCNDFPQLLRLYKLFASLLLCRTNYTLGNEKKSEFSFCISLVFS